GLLLGGVLDRDLALELGGDELDLVVGERLGRRLPDPELHQHLDDLPHRDAERLGEVADGDAGLDRDRPGGRRHLARRLGLARLRAVAGALALPGAGPAAAALDDDAPLPVPRPAAASGSDRSTARHRGSSSVEPGQPRVDADGRAQGAREPAVGAGPLEAREPPARVDAAARAGARDELAALGAEAHELRPGRLAPAARARPDRGA